MPSVDVAVDGSERSKDSSASAAEGLERSSASAAERRRTKWTVAALEPPFLEYDPRDTVIRAMAGSAVANIVFRVFMRPWLIVLAVSFGAAMTAFFILAVTGAVPKVYSLMTCTVYFPMAYIFLFLNVRIAKHILYSWGALAQGFIACVCVMCVCDMFSFDIRSVLIINYALANELVYFFDAYIRGRKFIGAWPMRVMLTFMSCGSAIILILYYAGKWKDVRATQFRAGAVMVDVQSVGITSFEILTALSWHHTFTAFRFNGSHLLVVRTPIIIVPEDTLSQYPLANAKDIERAFATRMSVEFGASFRELLDKDQRRDLDA